MNLEDSLGDILRKARTSTQTTVEAAAAAAGLSEEAYAAFESSGQAPAGTRFGPLGELLTLGGSRLEALSRGWRPAPVDLSVWKQFEMITTAGDDMTVNAFLAWDPASREAVLFDTGFDAAPIIQRIDAEGLRLTDIFITHSHGDHVAALGPLKARYPSVRVHSGARQAPAGQQLVAGKVYEVGALRIAHRPTPGHAEDGVTFLVTGWTDNAPTVAVVGDAIFSGSMGGARDQLALARTKVREEILSKPDSTLICPGHGPLTTVGQERENNPWFP